MAEILIPIAVNLAIATAVSLLFPTNTRQQGQRLDELGVVGSRYGAGIPVLHGRDRVPGNIIWALPLREVVSTDEQSAGKGSTVTTTLYSYYATFAALLCAGDADLQPRRIWCDKKLLWEAPDTGVTLAGDLTGGGSFEFMPGSPTQTRSATMEAALGTDDCPAYRGRCVIVFADVPVEQFGRRVPLVEVEVARGVYNVNAIASDVLLDLCERAGLDAGDIDVSDVTSEVHGVRLMPGAAAGHIETLMNGLGLQSVGTGTQLAFRPIEQTVTVEIDEAELLAGEEGRFPIRRVREDQLPRSVAINHFDPDRDYQVGTQLQQRQAARTTQALVFDSPLALSAAQAFATADSILYRTWTARTQYGPFSLPPRYLALEPGDVVGITVDGRRHEVRLRTVAIGANGALRCEGEAYDATVLTGVDGGSSGDFGGQGPPVYGDTTLRLLDVPALTDAQAAQVGYRIAATGSGAAWRTGVLEVSVDSGATWLAVATLPAYTTLGFCASTLAAPPAHIGAANIDTVSTLDVSMVKGTLSSVSDALLMNGANRCMVGDEMLQFGTATLTSPGNYTLSRLLRGRRGTEWAMDTHDVDEEFTVLAGTVFVAASVADLGTERLYRITPSGGEASSSLTFTLAGASARPFGPSAVAGSRDGGLNLTITWVRRSRIGTELPNSGDIPLDEPSESYSVDILDGPDVVRTISATAQTCSYTAAQQVTDFGSAQPAIDIRVYQVGQLVGRGTPTEATV